MAMREYHNPVVNLQSTQFNDQTRELKRLNETMDQLKSQQKDLLKLDSLSKMELAPVGKEAYIELMKGKMQDPILALLQRSNIALSTFNIADELNQDADVVFAILSYLEQITPIRQTTDMKWKYEG